VREGGGEGVIDSYLLVLATYIRSSFLSAASCGKVEVLSLEWPGAQAGQIIKLVAMEMLFIQAKCLDNLVSCYGHKQMLLTYLK
jgi:hypothetical protein